MAKLWQEIAKNVEKLKISSGKPIINACKNEEICYNKQVFQF